MGANAHVLEEYLYDIAYTPQESNNPEITANYVTLYTNEWMTHKATLGKYLVIIPLIILTILTINYGCSLLVKKKESPWTSDVIIDIAEQYFSHLHKEYLKKQKNPTAQTERNTKARKRSRSEKESII